MTVKTIIDVLNNLTTGELGRLTERVREARDESRALGLGEVTEILETALQHLEQGDLKGFRKKINHAVSRLGHSR